MSPAATIFICLSIAVPGALLVAAVVNDYREWRAHMRRREGFR